MDFDNNFYFTLAFYVSRKVVQLLMEVLLRSRDFYVIVVILNAMH